jgi:thiopurine S-methyltransferase
MHHEFWHERWRDGRIGFHEGRVNGLLSRHVAWLESATRVRGAAPLRVFVPLCGKAEDMAWLASRGHEVVGVELSEVAIAQFFVEHGIEPSREAKGRVVEWSGGPFHLLEGDVFACDPSVLGPLDALYDRAATVALPQPLRADYLRHVAQVMRPAARGLLVAFEYDTSRMEGPPFSVGRGDLDAGLAGVQIAALETVDSTIGPSATPCRETCWALEFP